MENRNYDWDKAWGQVSRNANSISQWAERLETANLAQLSEMEIKKLERRYFEANRQDNDLLSQIEVENARRQTQG